MSSRMFSQILENHIQYVVIYQKTLILELEKDEFLNKNKQNCHGDVSILHYLPNTK